MSIIKPGALIFDIGANWGQSAERFLAAGAGHVLSVEPCWQNYLVLREMSDDRVIPLHAAAWMRNEVIQVSFALNGPGWSSVVPEKWSQAYQAKWAEPECVTGITLDSLVNQYGLPDCIKIDVEGAESEVLEGLTKHPRLLIYEFHHKFVEDALGCLEYADSLGYKLATYTTDSLDLVTEPFLDFDEFRKRFTDEKPNWGKITLR